MAYDAEALLATLRVPEVHVRRTLWWEKPLILLGFLKRTVVLKGRLLSHEEWLPIEAALSRVQAGAATDLEIIGIYHDVIRAFGFNPKRFAHLPWRSVLEMVNDFLACQIPALFPERPGKTTTSVSGVASTPGAGTRNGTHTHTRATSDV